MAGDPFSLSPSFPSLLPLRRYFVSLSPLCVFQARRRAVSGVPASWSLHGARRRSPSGFVDSVSTFSKLPSPMWYVCGLWAAPGWSISWVYLSVGVATAGCCHDVLPRRNRVAVAVPFPIAMGRFAIRTFWWGTRQLTSLRSVTEGDTFMVMSWQQCQEGSGSFVHAFGWPKALSRVCACLVLAELVVGYKPAVQRGCLHCLGPPSSGAFERAFGATSVLELAAELADSRAEGKTRMLVPVLSSVCSWRVRCQLLVGSPIVRGLAVYSVKLHWRYSELLTRDSHVVVGNCVLCRVLLATEWVADWSFPLWLSATMYSARFRWRQSALLTGVSRVAAGNYVLCRVLLATERVADWLVPTARHTALAGDPFSLSPSFPSLLPLRRCSASLSPLCVFQARWRVVSGRDCLNPFRSGWIGSPSGFVDSVSSFSLLPSTVWYVCGLWAAPGWSIPWVCLSIGVATVVCFATPEEASARSVFLVPLACTVALAWLCLAPVGVVGLAFGRLVLLVVSASVFSRFCGPILGCAEHCFRFVPDFVGFCGSRAHPPYFLQLGARRRGSSVSDGLRRQLWRRVVVSSSESECCELLYLSELRVVFCKSSGCNRSCSRPTLQLDLQHRIPSKPTDGATPPIPPPARWSCCSSPHLPQYYWKLSKPIHPHLLLDLPEHPLDPAGWQLTLGLVGPPATRQVGCKGRGSEFES
ncbi:hypothetical protein Taro_032360 [Colocasia esculenta]|uniref:Transmembrane protein n=1 Tax=Colocasia esculenta TaxID=4460 RepID=A0A843VUN5_COLES|nr:hypothetical protein [Colocasia esculenta]